MGFVDDKRKWLYPEEALYLMEINCLEVYDNDVPFSLQQAYRVFLRTPANRNQYQVYAHLRRLGYSVIRHQGRSDTTRYEQNLKLNQYTKDGKKRKISRNTGTNKSCKPEKHPIVSESTNAEGNLCKRLKTDAVETPEAVYDNSQSFSVAANSSERTDNVMRAVHNQDADKSTDPQNTKLDCEPISEVRIDRMSAPLLPQQTNSVEAPSKKEPTKMEPEDSPKDTKSNSLILEPNKTSLSCKFDENSNSCQTDNCQTESLTKNCSWFGEADRSSGQSFDSEDNSGRLSPNFLSDMKKLRVLKDDDETLCKIFMYPKWNFQEYNFPNIAHLMRVTCPRPADSVTIPLFGEPLPGGNFDFDIQEYRETVMSQHKFCRNSKGPMERLEFSFVENYQHEKKAAKNWTDYKKICDLEKQKKSGSPLEFLWQGEVKPLVAPEDATSTGAILDKLQIVKHAEFHVSSMAERPTTCPEKWTVVFDVYQPNANFKKTNPGIPYFRVCVCGTDEDPPTVSDVIQFSKYFADDVPVNWAVVDNGEISFYIFRGVNIPSNP